MTKKPFKVLFVCTGNICRSPLAHAVFAKLVADAGRADEFEIESAGTHGYHTGENADPRTRANAKLHGYPFNHAARQVSRSDLDQYDLVLAMDHGHLRELRALGGNAVKARVAMFRDYDPIEPGADVPDPYYGGPDGFDKVFFMVERTCKALLDRLKTEGLV